MIVRRELARKWARVNVLKAERAGTCLQDAHRALLTAQRTRVALVSEHEDQETRLFREGDGVSAAWLTVLDGSRTRLADALMEADELTEAATAHVHDCAEQAQEATRWQDVSAKVEETLKRQAHTLSCRTDQQATDEAATRRWQISSHREA